VVKHVKNIGSTPYFVNFAQKNDPPFWGESYLAGIPALLKNHILCRGEHLHYISSYYLEPLGISFQK
jgi:hypothetical protein